MQQMERFQEVFYTINTDIIPQLKIVMTDNAVLILAAAFVILMVYMGRRKGFIAKILSVGALIITLIAEVKLFPYVLSLLEKNEIVGDFFLNIARSMIKLNGSEAGSSPLYDLLGLDLLAENAADMIETLAVKILCFIVIFIAVRLLLGIVSMLARGLKRIRLFDAADRLLGMLLGAAEALLLIWIMMIVVSGLPDVPVCGFILDQIMENRILLEIYNQNLLMQFAADLLM